MGVNDDEYWVPEHVREWLRSLGFSLPLEDMEPHIRAWDRWMRALGDCYDYRDTDGVGRVYEVHRRSINPAMRVCREWGSLESGSVRAVTFFVLFLLDTLGPACFRQ